MKIISCIGYGNSGSSIVTDFFQEFSSIKVFGGSFFEFTFLHEADGIYDLQNSLAEGNRFKTDLAIKRFLKLAESLNYKNPSGPNYKDYFDGKFLEYTKEYLNSLGVIAWKNGWWHRIFESQKKERIKTLVLRNRFERLVKQEKYVLYETDSWKPPYLNFTEEYYCHTDISFFRSKTKIYLQKLFSKIGSENDTVCFDQLLPHNCNEDYLEFFEDVKGIVVDRDPRDLYFGNKVFWGSGYIPSENVETFVRWYKETRNCLCKNKNILSVNFEDMVYNTEKIQNEICDFVGIDIRLHDKANTRLFLEKSKTNTLLFKKFVLENSEFQNEIQEDIKKIENELRDFLFDFSKFAKEEIIPQKINFNYEQTLQEVKKRKICFFEIFPACFNFMLKKLTNKFFSSKGVRDR